MSEYSLQSGIQTETSSVKAEGGTVHKRSRTSLDNYTSFVGLDSLIDTQFDNVKQIDIDKAVEHFHSNYGENPYADLLKDNPSIRALHEAFVMRKLNNLGFTTIPQIHSMYFITENSGNYLQIEMEQIKNYITYEEFVSESPFHTLEDRRSIVSGILEESTTLAEEVDTLHSLNIIHRDIKGSNLLLQYRNVDGRIIYTPRLLDFGLVLENGDTHVNKLRALGTVTHTAPEQLINSANAVPASDQFSIGIVYAEIMAGQSKITNRLKENDPIEMALRVRALPQEPAFINELEEIIKTNLQTSNEHAEKIGKVLRRATHYRPEFRFRNIVDFISALKTAYEDGDISKYFADLDDSTSMEEEDKESTETVKDEDLSPKDNLGTTLFRKLGNIINKK